MRVSESLSLLGVDLSQDLRRARQAEEETRQRRILTRVSPAPSRTVPGPSNRSSALLKPRSPRPCAREFTTTPEERAGQRFASKVMDRGQKYGWNL